MRCHFMLCIWIPSMHIDNNLTCVMDPASTDNDKYAWNTPADYPELVCISDIKAVIGN